MESPRIVATIQSRIDVGHRLYANHERLWPRPCSHSGEVDLKKLADRLGPDFDMVEHRSEFLKMLKCTACNRKGEVSIVFVAGNQWNGQGAHSLG